MKDHSIKPKYFENEKVAPLSSTRSGAGAAATSKNSS